MATAANADQWVRVIPGTEGLLALALLSVMVSEHNANSSMIEILTGEDSWLESYNPESVAAQIGIDSEVIRHIAAEFIDSEHPLALGGGSAAAHTNGLAAMKAVYSLNLVTGNLGQEGGVILNPASPLEGISVAEPGNSFSEFQDLIRDMDAESKVLSHASFWGIDQPSASNSSMYLELINASGPLRPSSKR